MFLPIRPDTHQMTYSGRATLLASLRSWWFVRFPLASWQHFHFCVYFNHFSDPNPQLPGQHFLHWLVVNIPGDLVHEGDTVAEYVPANPSPDHGKLFFRISLLWKVTAAGPQPFIFLVFQQPQRIIDPALGYINSFTSEGRTYDTWSTQQFLQRNQLERPLAGNFFAVSAEDPLLYITKWCNL